MAEDIRFTDLNSIRIAKPCRASWNGMQTVEGDRVRHCRECNLHVYNLSEMSRREAVKLIEEHEGHLCVRFYRRKDGTILTQDCPVGVKTAEHTFLKIVGRMLAWPFNVMLAIPAIRLRLQELSSYKGGIDGDSFCPPDLADLWWERYSNERDVEEAVRKRVKEESRSREVAKPESLEGITE